MDEPNIAIFRVATASGNGGKAMGCDGGQGT